MIILFHCILLTTSIEAATGSQTAFMHYGEGYERLVEAKWGWRLVGWPDGVELKPLSQVGSGGTAIAADLWSRLESGQCHWERLAPDIHQAIKAKYASRTSGKAPRATKRKADEGERQVRKKRRSA